MKRLIGFIVIMFAFVAVNAQTVNKTVNISPTLDGVYGTFFGAAADTLTASATKNYIFLINSPYNMDLIIQLNSTKVSGSPAYTSTLYESLDGVNWSAITNLSGVAKSAGTDYSTLYITAKTSSGAIFSGRYLKIAVVATSATQKSTLLGQFKFVRKYVNP